MTTTIDILVKFGQKVHMKNLFEKGEVFLNTIEFFKNHENPEIGDRYENIVSIHQLEKIIIDKKELPILSGHLVQHSHENGNLYCLFSIKDVDFTGSLDENTIEFDLNYFQGFGDCACVIHKPKEFISNIIRELAANGLAAACQPVDYYDPEIHNGSVNIFMKQNKFSHQKELRIHVDSDKNEPIIVNIGSLENIALFFDDINTRIQIKDDGEGLIFRHKTNI